MRPLFNYLSASRSELAKVAWPNRQQTVRLTMLVIGFSLVVAVIVGALDSVFSYALQKLIS